MTVAQTNISLLRNTNRQLQLELNQAKVYIDELEQKLNTANANNESTQAELKSVKEEFEAYKEAHPDSSSP